jgi:iron complex outermembrane receptor protein
VTFRAAPALNLYVSYGQGFETPTLNELAYRSTDGSIPGLNFALRPSHSDDYEIGAKAKLQGAHIDLALFHIDTRDEIAVAASANGRAVYQNVGGTTRDGIEASFDKTWPNGFGLKIAYSLLRAVYATPFRTCPGLPCALTQIAAGKRIPGVPRSTLFGEANWRDPDIGFSAALDLRDESKIFVNDLNSDAAPHYVVADLRAGFTQDWGPWRFKEFVDAQNLLDRSYAGSVIVDESNGRYFEPAPNRSASIGIGAGYRW